MLRRITQSGVLQFRDAINRLVDRQWNDYPFGRKPHATRAEYLALFETAKTVAAPEIELLEEETGFAVDRAWLDELALHTQIVKKKSDLLYVHGRMLYSLLRKQIADNGVSFVTALETGTARGFSTLCLAKALHDGGVDGRIISVDVLPHLKRQIWNCIDDHDGAKTRAELLAPWRDLTRKIVFLQSDTLYALPRLGLDRIHFAFLDAQHSKRNVLHEYAAVEKAQKRGDMIVFDDVTKKNFPGVVAAVDEIEGLGLYRVRRLEHSQERGYAWAIRN